MNPQKEYHWMIVLPLVAPRKVQTVVLKAIEVLFGASLIRIQVKNKHTLCRKYWKIVGIQLIYLRWLTALHVQHDSYHCRMINSFQVHARFLKLFPEKCVCACLHIVLSLCNHVSKPLTDKSSLYTRNKS